MRHEMSHPAGRALEELRTIQYLEETVGPAGLRRLADALGNDDERAIVQDIRRRAATTGLELENIIEEWHQAISQVPRRVRPLEEGGLDSNEMVESFVEVKRASAELLRRAAKEAPNEALQKRLHDLAADEEQAAVKLDRLKRDEP